MTVKEVLNDDNVTFNVDYTYVVYGGNEPDRVEYNPKLHDNLTVRRPRRYLTYDDSEIILDIYVKEKNIPIIVGETIKNVYKDYMNNSVQLKNGYKFLIHDYYTGLTVEYDKKYNNCVVERCSGYYVTSGQFILYADGKNA